MFVRLLYVCWCALCRFLYGFLICCVYGLCMVVDMVCTFCVWFLLCVCIACNVLLYVVCTCFVRVVSVCVEVFDMWLYGFVCF